MLDTRAFWQLEPSRDLAACPLRSCCVQSQLGMSLKFLIPSQLSGDITWFQYMRPSWRLEANIPAWKRSRHVYLEANIILFNVNQPKPKTTILTVCIPGYASTCLLHSVDRYIAYVVHPWSIVDHLDRWSPWSISNHILNLDQKWMRYWLRLHRGSKQDRR